MKIGLGSDHNAYEMKEDLKRYIEDLGHEVVDYGSQDNCTEVDYPEVAFEVSDGINRGTLDRAILVCGTGLGMAIAACKVPGIRAVTAHDTYSAERARKSNNAQVLTMGAKVIGIEAAMKVVEMYLQSDFPGGNSARKVQQIMDKELEYLQGTGSNA
ncbi:RpiB/LacA/LacB family sugar-phosphate isomerase [Sporosarcina pasteurii]|uniref:Ribose-5-phosphate isomerase B n=1 Tax=Sporosarcina pasteurii TaxID=1474 RepID=A0A380BF33_SPOPA|nr:RpiB/LacA/LacB family sugar-phosphate isomerase [Sporosarcina pasteurii]MDS9472577.1 RpiB/LacA/LacB family sugar-phosphate isomerase [Sporosarcina pasteurii]QBQ06129.1 RpiB/LacA/LacB family sugar-phosphate isomerase [Sporosarcina pasteurii]SUI99372.1 Ribose-5-phosphate isomerase B [Sporosarcina pasteurii]